MTRQFASMRAKSTQPARLFLLQAPTFEGREGIAALALGAIASWSAVELAQLRVFTALLGGSKTLASEIFAALKSGKVAAVDVAGRGRFPHNSEEARVFGALRKASSKAELERNKLAHWVWGQCTAFPEYLMLVDPKDITLRGSHHADAAVAYAAQDFRRIIERNGQLSALWAELAKLVNLKPGSSYYESVLAGLRAAPALQ